MTESMTERVWLDLSAAMSQVPEQQQSIYLAKLALLLGVALNDAEAFAGACAEAGRHLGGTER